VKEVVINKQYGGFGLSPEAQVMLAGFQGKHLFFYVQTKMRFRDGVDEFRRTNQPKDAFLVYTLTRDLGEVVNDLPNGDDWFSEGDIARDDPNLVKVVKELGDAANTTFSTLVIVKIPDDVEWEVEEYDGLEWVAEKHRTWG
jgi:hypothetical protein